MTSQDTCWMQRFSNFRKVMLTISEAADLASTRRLSNLEQQGLIQGFEFTDELAWNVLKDYLEAQGFVGIIGSRNATREAFKNALLADGEVWMHMIKARNLTSHTYSTAIAQEIAADILRRFYPAFKAMAATFNAFLKGNTEQGDTLCMKYGLSRNDRQNQCGFCIISGS